MTKQYFTKEEALKDIKDYLENGGDCYGADLHHEVFNTDYYIIGSHEAKQALEQYGAFDAIAEIKDYEEFNFGKIFTDLSDPEKVANMLYYIKGYEAIGEINDILDEDWDNKIAEETRKALVRRIDELTE